MGRHDAIEKIAGRPVRKPKRILDADIKGRFYNIDHGYLAKQVDKHRRPKAAAKGRIHL